jgi:hypothetical protein
MGRQHFRLLWILTPELLIWSDCHAYLDGVAAALAFLIVNGSPWLNLVEAYLGPVIGYFHRPLLVSLVLCFVWFSPLGWRGSSGLLSTLSIGTLAFLIWLSLLPLALLTTPLGGSGCSHLSRGN